MHAKQHNAQSRDNITILSGHREHSSQEMQQHESLYNLPHQIVYAMITDNQYWTCNIAAAPEQ